MRSRSIQGVFVLSLTVACQAVLAQAIFRCEGPGGTKVLQQAPCAGGQALGARATRTRFTDELEPKEAADPKRTAAQVEAERLAAVSPGISGGFPVVGMTRIELIQAMGVPDRVSVSDYGRGLEEQRTYDRGDRTLQVYTKNGHVTTVQNTERAGAPKRIEPCPSQVAVRHAYAAASGNAMTEKERELQLKRAREMEQCR